MEGECRVPVDAAVDTEARKQATHSSKFVPVLLGFTLCLAFAAAAVLVLDRHNKEPARDEDDIDLHHALRQISNVRAAIHLKGRYNAGMTSVEWQDNVVHSQSQGGLKLHDNEIVIPKNGLYFVYSQASFSVGCSSSEADDVSSSQPVHLSHAVTHLSKSLGGNDYHPILHSIRSVCQKAEGIWYSTIYMGAVFKLDKGDRLRTETMEAMLPNLMDEAGGTFFGVFAL